MSTKAFEIRDLHFAYKNGREILKGINLELTYGNLVSILGKNGAGKSTLFKCMLGLVKNYSGEILIDGEDVKSISAKQLAGKVAYIPQSHFPSFNYSVLDMVLMGTANQISGIGSPGNRHIESAEKALARVGISELRDRGYAQISGGEQQLVLMARAIVQDARIWMLDEPLASLDYGNQIRVLNQLKDLSRDGYLIIQSIHNPGQAYRYSDNVIALSDGIIIKYGKPEEVISAELINTLYNIDIDVEGILTK